MSALVSVPCGSCSTPICFGDIACPGCHRAVSDGARSNLEARLAASSSEFRELKGKLESARSTVLGIAGVEFCYGMLVAFARGSAEHDFDTGWSFATTFTVASSLFTAAVFLGLFFLARERPGTALLATFGLWLTAQLVAGVVSPLTIFAGVWMKIIVLTLLTRGILSARRAAAIRKRFAAESIAARHAA